MVESVVSSEPDALVLHSAAYRSLIHSHVLERYMGVDKSGLITVWTRE